MHKGWTRFRRLFRYQMADIVVWVSALYRWLLPTYGELMHLITLPVTVLIAWPLPILVPASSCSYYFFQNFLGQVDVELRHSIQYLKPSLTRRDCQLLSSFMHRLFLFWCSNRNSICSGNKRQCWYTSNIRRELSSHLQGNLSRSLQICFLPRKDRL